MFVPLHVKSHWSLGQGTASAEAWADRAAALGYSALALTDAGNLYGQVRFHQACRRHGLHALTGVELQLGPRRGRLVLLARDLAGYSQLCRIVTMTGASPSGVLPLVCGAGPGIIALTADPILLTRLHDGGMAADQLGLFVLRPPRPPALEQAILLAARRHRVPLVADLDLLLCEAKDYDLALLQLAMQQQRMIAEVAPETGALIRQRLLEHPQQAASYFSDLPEAVTATAALAASCTLDLSRPLGILPASPLAPDEDPQEELASRCRRALAARRGAGLLCGAAYDSRLAQELAVIQSRGLAGLLLVISELSSFARGRDIELVGRGVTGNSLVIYLLGATNWDPVAAGLPFERLLHPTGEHLPKIELDLPFHRRNEVIAWATGHFAQGRAALAGSLHCFTLREALRDGLRTLGRSPEEIARLSKKLLPQELEEPPVFQLSARAPRGNSYQLQESWGLRRSLSLARQLVGIPRYLTAHAGGLVIADRPLEHLVPLEQAPSGRRVTQYDAKSLSQLGLAMLDLQGNRCLSELEQTARLLRAQDAAGEASAALAGGLSQVPLDDEPTLQLIDQAQTIGISQLESPAMRGLLAQLPVRRLADVAAALALIRPGAAAGQIKRAYLTRSQEETAAPQDGLLAESYGLPLFQEDLLQLLATAGDLTPGAAESLRGRIVAAGDDRPQLLHLEQTFVARAVQAWGERGERPAREAWQAAVAFAACSLNKFHALSAGRLAYLAAYARTHAPAAFASALLDYHQGPYPRRTVVAALQRAGVAFLLPDVNASDEASTPAAGASGGCGSVRVGLGVIKGLPRAQAREIVISRTRAGAFESVNDLNQRVALSRRQLERLIRCGACDELPPLSAEDYPFAHDHLLRLLAQGKAVPAAGTPWRLRPDGERLPLYVGLTRVERELEALGMHLSAHPLALLRPDALRLGCLPLATAADNPGAVRVLVLIAAVQRLATARGVRRLITLEDESGLLEAVIPPGPYRQLGSNRQRPGPLLVAGILRLEEGVLRLIVRQLRPFLRRPLASSQRGRVPGDRRQGDGLLFPAKR